MRGASPWVVCLVSLVCLGGVGCKQRQEAEKADPADLAASQAACPSGNCTIRLIEAAGKCEVDPPVLYIDSGYDVTFTTEVSADTEAVEITPKKSTPLKFQSGAPSRIARGRSFNTGPVTGKAGESYEYTATYLGLAKQPCPPVDPVICIKDGIIADTCN